MPTMEEISVTRSPRDAAARGRLLWMAVIARAVRDAEGVGGVRETSGHARDFEVRMARNWFRRGGRDFCEVCTLAGFEPSAVRAAFLTGRLTAESLREKPGEILG